MRKIPAQLLTKTVAELAIQANINLRPDVYQALVKAQAQETNIRARKILNMLLENADCARKFNLAICQDTGLPYVFVELGQEVSISRGEFIKAINKGIERGYQKGALRNSIINHPLKRNARPRSSPAVVHLDLVKGRQIKISVLPKGFGSENKSRAQMFQPTASIEEIKKFIVASVKQAGADACPPYIVGVGIGGGFDQAALLAKKALLRPINRINFDFLLAKLERELLQKINLLGIGPMGLGGKTTCLRVSIKTAPTHIAGLAVAVNISCHALRSAAKRI